MNKAFEKILERLEATRYIAQDDSVAELIRTRIWNKALHKVKQIVKEVAEQYKDGWIPCSERLPEETGEYLTTSKIYFVPDHVDEIDNYVGVKISHYSTRYGWLDDEVIAWQPLPEPFKERD